MKTTYATILKLLKKHKNDIVFNVDDLQRQAENHLFGLELRDTYGLNIDPAKVNSTTSFKCNEHFYICIFGEKHNRTISWPDVKGQPKNELLLWISFPTGAYIFGQDYPTEFFKQFWEELKSYNPKYSDTMNHNLYWDLPNAKDVFNNYPAILNKYRELNREDIKKRQIAKMEADLAKFKETA